MVKLKNSKFEALKKVMFIFILALAISCSDGLFSTSVDCDDCYASKPAFADLTLAINPARSAEGFVRITIYEGDYEENRVYLTDSVTESMYKVSVPIDQHYTVSAAYALPGSGWYYVVDGTTPKTNLVYDVCTESCWAVFNNTLNLRARYPEAMR